jgi:type IV pilus assembly protein PilF
MNTLRLVLLFGCAAVLAACAGSGTVGQRASSSDAAIANLNLGAGYLRQGNTTLAIERLQRALDQDPRNVQAHSTIALAYDQAGSLEEAEMHYRRATQLDPASGVAANFYAVFLCNRQKRWADAEPYFRRAANDPNYPTPEAALTNAGVCARDAGQNEAAVENFRAALARNASYPDALVNMMALSYEQQNFLQTRAFVQRYLAANSPTAPVLWLCFNVERELKDEAAADRCAAQLRSGFRGSDELARLEEQQRRDGQQSRDGR